MDDYFLVASGSNEIDSKFSSILQSMSKEGAKKRISLDSSLIPSASGELYFIVRVYVIIIYDTLAMQLLWAQMASFLVVYCES
jgi:hypothetical protein